MKAFKFILILLSISLVTLSCKKDEQEEIEETGPSFIVKVDGVELKNNDFKTYTGIGENGTMDLRITNKKDTPINLVIEVVSITGTDGSITELCLGNCYSSITVGEKYPLDSSYELAVGETTVSGIAHIVNQDDRSGDLDFKFDLYEVDENNERLSSGTSLKFGYKYDAP